MADITYKLCPIKVMRVISNDVGVKHEINTGRDRVIQTFILIHFIQKIYGTSGAMHQPYLFTNLRLDRIAGGQDGREGMRGER